MLNLLSLTEARQWVNTHRLGKEKKLTTLSRIAFNLYPAHLMTGGRLLYFSPCNRRALMTLPKTWRTRGLLGNIFGGNMYAAIDAIPMVLMFKNIDRKRFLMWDKSGHIHYKKPAYCKRLYASLDISEEEQTLIIDTLEREGQYDFHIQFSLVCSKGHVYANVDKVVHLECKQRFAERRNAKQQTV
jgi:hypothetical protein